jgi:outer membrane protein
MKRFTHSAFTIQLALVLGLSAASGLANAQSLSQMYEAARSYDATYLSAKAQFEANVARVDQAKAGLLPSITYTDSIAHGLNTNKYNVGTNPPASPQARSFGARQGVLSISQALYRPANLATYYQGQKQLIQADVALQAAEQDLIVRVSSAYFDVLASKDSLTFVKAQKAAVAEQLASAKRNFEVGTSTITDTREAQARFDLTLAQEITAANDLRVMELALNNLVGQSSALPWGLKTPSVLPTIPADGMSQWVETAQSEHPSIRLAQMALDIAKLETDKATAGHKPTLDGALSVSDTSNSAGSSLAGSTLDTRNVNTQASLLLTIPLFAGFATQNRIKETVALEEKARIDLENAKRSVAQTTRVAYLGVLSGTGSVKAFEAAESSSQSALDANKLGYQVGVRINIDVLNAQSQLFQTKRDLAKARYDVLVGHLKLRQANGSLKADDLSLINALLTQ